ncbi:MAG TPA: sigma-54 dependent transcriptional regulator, partial [Terriglobales bacterium]|nr:sigma-54 dependent transcriptional regulator [Terriglobales bacterium]
MSQKNAHSAAVLIVEDEPKMRRLLELQLADEGFATHAAADAESGLGILQREKVDLVLTDFRLPGMSGVEFLQAVKRANALLPVVIMTAYGSVESAVEAMKLGASDYVLKPFALAELVLVIRKELEAHRLREENRSLREALGQRYAYENIVARSQKMQAVLALVERVAPTQATVLLGGETGVGKDLVARAIHQHSQRAAGPFVKINSTAIPETLLESELFGYEKGAFTGAAGSKPGKFELAHKGTLFLDEIGDVPPATQVKLLRVLQEREFERLGGTKTLHVDVRLIAATNRDLRSALEEGSFREDLYYRLNVVAIDIPPLRERKEDVPALAEHFLARFARESGKKIAGLAPEALKRLVDFHWPGNVRELENVMERAVTLCAGSMLGAGDIHLDSRPAAAAGAAPVLPEGAT